MTLQNHLPVPESGCWLWLGSWDKHGYGKTPGTDGSRKAHRVYFQHHNGPIPNGLSVCHRCDTPACVNPDHLFLGDAKTNAADMKAKGRGRLAKGEANTAAKLKEAQVISIFKDMRKSSAIASHYGVSKATVIGIQKGYLWTHLRLREKHSGRFDNSTFFKEPTNG